MEIRAALGPHFVGYNTGRWDYINSVADAMAWDRSFINPNIEDITMTYGYMRNYEDRVRRAVNTADTDGRFALWQGGMEPNIPVGSEVGVAASLERAVAAGCTKDTLPDWPPRHDSGKRAGLAKNFLDLWASWGRLQWGSRCKCDDLDLLVRKIH